MNVDGVIFTRIVGVFVVVCAVTGSTAAAGAVTVVTVATFV